MVTLQDLFEYQIAPGSGESAGRLRPTGIRPTTSKFDRRAVELPPWMAVANLGGAPAPISGANRLQPGRVGR